MKEPNNSPEWRRECEAREIMKWSPHRRTGHYDAIKHTRGAKARDELIAEVNRQYRLRDARAMEI